MYFEKSRRKVRFKDLQKIELTRIYEILATNLEEAKNIRLENKNRPDQKPITRADILYHIAKSTIDAFVDVHGTTSSFAENYQDSVRTLQGGTMSGSKRK